MSEETSLHFPLNSHTEHDARDRDTPDDSVHLDHSTRKQACLSRCELSMGTNVQGDSTCGRNPSSAPTTQTRTHTVPKTHRFIQGLVFDHTKAQTGDEKVGDNNYNFCQVNGARQTVEINSKICFVHPKGTNVFFFFETNCFCLSVNKRYFCIWRKVVSGDFSAPQTHATQCALLLKKKHNHMENKLLEGDVFKAKTHRYTRTQNQFLPFKI